MSIVFSYLVVPVLLLMILVNVFLRIKIIKRYKSLRDQDINIHPGMIFKTEKAKSYFEKHYPNHADSAHRLTKDLKNLIYFTVGGFILILIFFFYIRLNQ